MKAKFQAEIDIDLEELKLTPAALIALLRSHTLNSGMAKGLIRFGMKFLDPEEKEDFLLELLKASQQETR
jgi:hypothetical protein